MSEYGEEDGFVDYNQPRNSNQYAQNPPNYPSQVSFGQNRVQPRPPYRNQNPVNLNIPMQNQPPATDRNYTQPLNGGPSELQRIQDELE